MDITKVGKIPAGRVSLAACLLGSVTIAVCYGIAVALGHVPVWLPMISDCAVEAPEKYLFRLGMISTASLVFYNATLFYFFIHSKLSSSGVDKAAIVLAAIASLGLGTLAAVNEKEDNSVHSTAAVIFFFGYEAFMIISTLRLQRCPSVSRSSLNVKRLISVVCAVLLGLFVHFSSDWGKYQIEIAMCEWSAVILILVFNGTMISEYKDEFSAELICAPTSNSASIDCTTSHMPVNPYLVAHPHAYPYVPYYANSDLYLPLNVAPTH